MLPPVEEAVLENNVEFANLYKTLSTVMLNRDGSTKIEPSAKQRNAVRTVRIGENLENRKQLLTPRTGTKRAPHQSCEAPPAHPGHLARGPTTPGHQAHGHARHARKGAGPTRRIVRAAGSPARPASPPPSVLVPRQTPAPGVSGPSPLQPAVLRPPGAPAPARPPGR